MKRVFFLLLCFYILMNNEDALALEDKNQGQVLNLESSNLVYDLGLVKKDEIINRIIKIRNRLDEPLVITEARSTCECVKIYVNPQVVEKGEIFEAEFTLDSTGIKQDIESVIYILTNNTNYKLIRLTILAKLIDFELILAPKEDNILKRDLLL